jgi:LytS/YehU family sensor histidine kinase
MDTFAYIFSLLVLIVFGLIAFRSYKKEQQLKRNNSSLQKENDELVNRIHSLELENSKFRLNPHLFKNTLNSIQAYAFRTHHAMEKLGGVLDYILYDSNVSFISIKSELEFAQNFIELNKIKLSPLYDFRLRNSVNEGNPFYNEPLISPLLTAHFIENAFKHADLQSNDAFIFISFELNGDEFIFTVSNKVLKTPPFASKGGIGKDNMQKRLEIIYGNAFTLGHSVIEGVHTAHLKINLRDVKNKMHSS